MEMSNKEISLPVFLSWVMIVLVMCVIFKQIWKRRKLYYCAAKLEGPTSWPLIGKVDLLAGGPEAFYESSLKLFQSNPTIFRFWMGLDLVIVNSHPQDLEILLNTCLEKAPLYKYADHFLKNGLVTSPVSIWKGHRKIINSSFNSKILNSFIDIFAKHSNQLVEKLNAYCGNGHLDLIPDIWECTLNIACETLANVNSCLLTGQAEYIAGVLRVEEILTRRVYNVWYALDYIWKFSALAKEQEAISHQVSEFVKKVIKIQKAVAPMTMEVESDDLKDKRFLNRLFYMKDKNNSITDEEILQETQTLFITASESTAFTVGFVLMTLSIHTDIQEKAYKELHSIFGESDRNPTLEDINRMEYLERVIKETMRVLPVVPVVMRRVDKDITINSCFYPEGSLIMIPIAYMCRKPELWRDPSVFDPDRFSPEETEKRHRCTFIPFSFGVRNCIGFKYGMLSMKVLVSSILRRYKLSSIVYKSIYDIKMHFSFISKPVNGCQVVLTRRKQADV